MPEEFSAGAVIFRRDTGKTFYLLLHYEEGHWDFVKGHIEKGEEDWQTIMRECVEETGIKDIELVVGFEKKIDYFYKREGKVMHKEVTFLLAQTKTKNITLSSEHIGFGWLEYDDAIARLTFKNAKEILSSANDFLEAH